MRNLHRTLAACLIGGVAGALAAAPAQAEVARDLMGRIPSVAELVEALTPAPPMKTRGIRPGGAGEIATQPSRPAVDLEVRFEFDSAALTPMARAVLDNLATALTTDLASYRFVLEGHTDAVGSDRYNLSLPRRRRTPDRGRQGRERAPAARPAGRRPEPPRARHQPGLTPPDEVYAARQGATSAGVAAPLAPAAISPAPIGQVHRTLQSGG